MLSWDEKWVYIISHIVKPGLVKPTTYSDQPWRRQKNNGNRSSSFKTKTAPYPNAYSEQARESAKSLQSSSSSSSSSSTSSTAHPAIYAVSIAKYAFKQGRLTIPPTTFLQACDLLPASPAGESSEAKSDPSITPPHEAPPLSSSSVDVDNNAPSILLRKTAPSKKQSVVGSETGRDDDLWRALEARRMRHLGLARHVAGLDEGFGVFTGEEEVVFARY